MAAPAFTGVTGFAEFGSGGTSGAATASAFTGTAGRAYLAISAGQPPTVGSNPATVSDNKGNTWARIGVEVDATQAGTPVRITAWLCASAATGGSGMAVTITAPNWFPTLWVGELDQAVTLDATSNTTDSSLPISGAVTAVASVTMGGFVTLPSTSNYASLNVTATGWTEIYTTQNAAGWPVSLLNKAVSGAGSVTCDASITNYNGDQIPVLTFTLAGTGGGPVDTPLNPGAAALTLTGRVPTLAQTASQTVSPAQKAITLTGPAPTLTQTANQAVSPAAASLTIAGQTPTIQQTNGATFTPATAALSVVGQAPVIAQTANQVFTPAAVALALSGFAPTIAQVSGSVTLTPAPAVLTVTGLFPYAGQTGQDPYPLGSGGSDSGFPSIAQQIEERRRTSLSDWAFKEQAQTAKLLNRKQRRAAKVPNVAPSDFGLQPAPAKIEPPKSQQRRIAQADRNEQMLRQAMADSLRAHEERQQQELQQRQAEEESARIAEETRHRQELEAQQERERVAIAARRRARNQQAIAHALAFFDM